MKYVFYHQALLLLYIHYRNCYNNLPGSSSGFFRNHILLNIALAVFLAVQHGATMPQLRITHYITAVFIFGVFDKGKKKLLFQNTVYVCDHTRVILFYLQKKEDT